MGGSVVCWVIGFLWHMIEPPVPSTYDEVIIPLTLLMYGSGPLMSLPAIVGTERVAACLAFTLWMVGVIYLFGVI